MAQVAMAANETAYTALRVFGKREGEKALYRVIELRGRSGAPQPSAWKLMVEDQKARGGVRELEVQRGRIVSERTPVGRNLGAPMNFNQLNLDSDGAFTVVNQEAQKRARPFDRLDYVLHGGTGGAPVWDIELFDGRTGRVGSMRISADTGEIIQQNFTGSGRNPEEDDRSFVEGSEPDRDRDRDGERRRVYRDDEEVGTTLPEFVDRVGRHFQRRGRQLENFFTGRRR
ncbi:MAG: hypothetical protein JWQ44_621 [Chthoniobacter sp.]|nr:hypothetical protein [Chthoniobacter sp.]